MAKDYYKILGVSRSANSDEIKRAFRKLAHQYHPDKKNGNVDKFKEVNEAYQVLGNTEKRQQYDQFGTTFDGAAGPQGGFSGFNGAGFDFSDIGDIFGDFFGGRRSARERRGKNIHMEMEIDFKDAVFGGEKVLDLYKPNVCKNCSGSGVDPQSKMINCDTCNGAGKVERVQKTFFGNFKTVSACTRCGGQGKIAEKDCGVCSGKGSVRENKKIKIKIPSGIENREAIRLQEEGEAGEKGIRPGDLYITFRIKPDDYFNREENNILTREKISFTQAALGDKIEVKTMEGNVRLTIPGGTQSGQIFKLRGKGVRDTVHGRGTGDQLVKIIVVTPNKISRKQKKLFKELEELS